MRELAAGSIHSRDTIAKRMKESGMVIRKPGRPKQGFKKSVQYSQEDLYTLIKTKREAGLTYRQITQKLSSQKILCKSVSTNWHPMMIKRILENNPHFS